MVVVVVVPSAWWSASIGAQVESSLCWSSSALLRGGPSGLGRGSSSSEGRVVPGQGEISLKGRRYWFLMATNGKFLYKGKKYKVGDL